MKWVHIQVETDCHFKVCVGNIYSDPYSQDAGVPQGSTIFFTLFSLNRFGHWSDENGLKCSPAIWVNLSTTKKNLDPHIHLFFNPIL